MNCSTTIFGCIRPNSEFQERFWSTKSHSHITRRIVKSRAAYKQNVARKIYWREIATTEQKWHRMPSANSIFAFFCIPVNTGELIRGMAIRNTLVSTRKICVGQWPVVRSLMLTATMLLFTLVLPLLALQETFSEQSKSSLSDRWVSFRDIDDGISGGAIDLMLSFQGKISKQSWVS